MRSCGVGLRLRSDGSSRYRSDGGGIAMENVARNRLTGTFGAGPRGVSGGGVGVRWLTRILVASAPPRHAAPRAALGDVQVCEMTPHAIQP